MYISLVISIVSGISLGLSVNYPTVWFLSVVSIAPIFYILFRRSSGGQEAFAHGLLFGFSFLGVAYAWFWQTLPLDWFGIQDTFFAIFSVFITWFLLTLTTALPVGVWALGSFYLRNRRTFAFIGIPLLWICLEFLRTFVFYILSLGPGSVFGPHFTMGFIGYAVAPAAPLLEWARFGGVYTLSFIVVLLNYLVYLGCVRGIIFKKKAAVGAGVVLILMSGGMVPSALGQGENENEQPIAFAVLHTDFQPMISISYAEERRRRQVLEGLLEQIRERGTRPDVIVFPEDSRFLERLISEGWATSYFNNIFGDREILIIDSTRVDDSSAGTKSKMLFFDTKKGLLGTSEKIFLVPHGEYTPYIYSAIMAVLDQSSLSELLKRNRSYTPGDGHIVVRYKDVVFGGVFCSESVSPVFYRELTKKGADVLVDVASQSYFHESRILSNQSLALSRVRAIENDRPIVQASNSAPSFVLNKDGQVIAESEGDGASVLYATIKVP